MSWPVSCPTRRIIPPFIEEDDAEADCKIVSALRTVGLSLSCLVLILTLMKLKEKEVSKWDSPVYITKHHCSHKE